MFGMATPDLTALAATVAKLETMLEPDGAVYRYTANALEQAVVTLRGSGADEVTVEMQVGGVPLPDADVWITSDAAGDNVVAGTLQTNSEGKAVFLLDAGNTYYLWMQKDGYNSIEGRAFVAVAD